MMPSRDSDGDPDGDSDNDLDGDLDWTLQTPGWEQQISLDPTPDELAAAAATTTTTASASAAATNPAPPRRRPAPTGPRDAGPPPARRRTGFARGGRGVARAAARSGARHVSGKRRRRGTEGGDVAGAREQRPWPLRPPAGPGWP